MIEQLNHNFISFEPLKGKSARNIPNNKSLYKKRPENDFMFIIRERSISDAQIH